jgi:putative oxidoreductase
MAHMLKSDSPVEGSLPDVAEAILGAKSKRELVSELSHVSRPAGSRMADVFLASIFIASGIDKLRRPHRNKQYMESKQLPSTSFLLVPAALLEILGGLATLLRFKPRASASILFSYLLPTTLVFHNFWKSKGEEREAQQVHFMKNLSILGGLAQVIFSNRSK